MFAGKKVRQIFDGDYKLGILGAGQLGKMLALAAGPWHIPVYALDKADHFPAVPFLHGFTTGDFAKEADVLAFGQQMDALTIEIEHVNTDALRALRSQGKTVHPVPDVLDIIKDKGLQKAFYQNHQLPTSSFILLEDAAAIQSAMQNRSLSYPFVQKARSGGYDGRGVAVIRSETDTVIDTPSVIEPLVDIEKELAVIVARNSNGEIRAYPPVEMVFDPVANLVEMLVCPAGIEPALASKATQIAIATAEAYGLSGLLAVELFLTTEGDILINEVAPRPHNSGHHTIESCVCSQFEQHVRAVLNLPLGDTRILRPAVMLNILGAAQHRGPVMYQGVEKILSMPDVHPHMYGKHETRPSRKMGHLTVLGETVQIALQKAALVRSLLPDFSVSKA